MLLSTSHMWLVRQKVKTRNKDRCGYILYAFIFFKGTHLVTPENISDGFYYVPLLSSLQALLSNENIFNQVNIIGYTILVGLLASMHAFPKLC